MDLTVADRILLLDVLPAQGDITTLRIVRQLREALSFSEQEHADLSMVAENGRVTWDTAKAAPKAVDIGPKAHAVIVAALKRRSAAGELQMSFIDLYDRFVESEDRHE